MISRELDYFNIGSDRNLNIKLRNFRQHLSMSIRDLSCPSWYHFFDKLHLDLILSNRLPQPLPSCFYNIKLPSSFRIIVSSYQRIEAAMYIHTHVLIWHSSDWFGMVNTGSYNESPQYSFKKAGGFHSFSGLALIRTMISESRQRLVNAEPWQENLILTICIRKLICNETIVSPKYLLKFSLLNSSIKIISFLVYIHVFIFVLPPLTRLPTSK